MLIYVHVCYIICDIGQSRPVLKCGVWGAGGDSVPPFPVRRAATGLHGPRGLLTPESLQTPKFAQPLFTMVPNLH